MRAGAAAVPSREKVGSIDAAAAWPELGARARDLVAWMTRVRRAETVYARYHVGMSRDGASVWRAFTARRLRREAALAFEELVRAVRGLRTSWELFCLRASDERLAWRAALRVTLPGLFEDARAGTDALRTDTTLSYAAARSARDIAACFCRRLENGFC